MNDWQLLNEYATRNSEEAFRTLVERYAGMVYHTALRQLGNSYSAEEAAQAVFIILAQKAAKIPRQTTLYGWLFRATRFAVLNRMRQENNRTRREQEAFTMQSTSHSDDPGSVWEQITPCLDDALDRLPATDRELVMIRYFGNKSHKEAAQALGLSEEAVRKRLSRAIERLRVIFARRGIAVSSLALVAVFTAHGVQAAPLGLASSFASVAVAKGATGTASTLSAARGILKHMAWAKLKTAVVVAAGVLLAAGTTSVLISAAASASGGNLPPGVRETWEKQKAAMNTLYLVCREDDTGPTSTNIVYFQGNHFYRREQWPGWDSECAFDGNIFYRLQHPSRGMPNFFLDKYSATDTTDPQRHYMQWDFSYLDAAGIYAPLYIPELERFSALEPLALHCLEESNPTKVEAEGDCLRVTFQVKDRWLADAQGFNVEQVRKQADNGANSPAFVASEVENVKRWHSMKPTRTIAFLLDPKRGYAVVEREEWTATGKLVARIVSDDWQHYPGPDLWLPGRSVVSYYTEPHQLDKFSDRPIRTVTNQLQRVEFGQKEIQFVLNSTQPGAFINDRTTREARSAPDHQVVSIVAGNGTVVRQPDHAGSVTPRHPKQGKHFLAWLTIVGAAMLGSLLFFWQKRNA